MTTPFLRKRLAMLMPDLPSGYVVYQQKNGRWVGKSPTRDLEVKSLDRDEVIYWLRLNALGPRP